VLRLLPFLAILTTGCATSFEVPRNTVDLSREAYSLRRQDMTEIIEMPVSGQGRYGDLARCADAELPLGLPPGPINSGGAALSAPPLSPGDMLRLSIADDDVFSGDYVISPEGQLHLPHLPPISAAGFQLDIVEQLAATAMLTHEMFVPGFLQVELQIAQWAPIQVYVAGAVFQPGDFLLNDRNVAQVQAGRVEAEGDVESGRTLTSALFAASGLRPDADVRHVVLVRNGERRLIDLSGAFNGQAFADPILAAGDQIHVLSRGCFQEALARPSRITMPGIRVYMSNLTRPAFSNANSAIGMDTTRLPYGTRFLQGLVAANCVGGTQATNADRYAVLISRNPVTGESEVIARSVEDLVRRADRDRFDPILLPGDALACYDSHVTNLRDVLGAFGEVLSPAISFTLLSGAN
jgi:polysaccharide biosynthesis/export protein